MKTASEGPDSIELLLLAATGLMLAAVAIVGWLTWSGLDRRYPVPEVAVELPEDAASIAEGERLAKTRGCTKCHGSDLAGKEYFVSARRGVYSVAPNLTRKIREYSPGEFAATVRFGVRPNGQALELGMPAFAFYNLSDADLAAIMSYVASLPEKEGLRGSYRLWPIGWYRYVTGDLLPPNVDFIDRQQPRVAPDETGRYLVASMCVECHGMPGRLRAPTAPDLGIARAYGEAEFTTLLREGVGLGGRELDGLMQQAAVMRYRSLRDEEIAAIYAYLTTEYRPEL